MLETVIGADDVPVGTGLVVFLALALLVIIAAFATAGWIQDMALERRVKSLQRIESQGRKIAAEYLGRHDACDMDAQGARGVYRVYMRQQRIAEWQGKYGRKRSGPCGWKEGRSVGTPMNGGILESDDGTGVEPV